MISEDIEYISKLMNDGFIKSPCLELGVGYGGPNCKSLVKSHGVDYIGTDLVSASEVDIIADFESSTEVIENIFCEREKFASILVLNVLEHTFDPIKVLDNVFHILQPGGFCIIITPTVCLSTT